jgi:hypothetical protein
MFDVRWFDAPRIGLGVITMTRRENKGTQVIYKYFKDIVHEHGLKSPHRTSKKDL